MEKKLLRSYKLHPTVIDLLERLSASNSLTATAQIEELIKAAAKKAGIKAKPVEPKKA